MLSFHNSFYIFVFYKCHTIFYGTLREVFRCSIVCVKYVLVYLQNTSIVCLEIHGLRYADYFIENIVYISVCHPTQWLRNTFVLCPLQATSCSALEMPTSSEILQVILEYVYTDESPTIKGVFVSAMLHISNIVLINIPFYSIRTGNALLVLTGVTDVLCSVPQTVWM